MNTLIKIGFAFVVAIGLCSGLNAAQFPVPAECPYADAEISTNLAFAASQLFNLTMSCQFAGTSSNSVEIAFGADADGDGVLSRTETDAAIAYESGAWSVTDFGGDARHTVEYSTGAQDFQLWVSLRDNAPRFLKAALNRSEILEGWAEAPPRFLFNPEWNLMRITARRMDGARLIVSNNYRFAPLIINIR